LCVRMFVRHMQGLYARGSVLKLGHASLTDTGWFTHQADFSSCGSGKCMGSGCQSYGPGVQGDAVELVYVRRPACVPCSVVCVQPQITARVGRPQSSAHSKGRLQTGRQRYLAQHLQRDGYWRLCVPPSPRRVFEAGAGFCLRRGRGSAPMHFIAYAAADCWVVDAEWHGMCAPSCAHTTDPFESAAEFLAPSF
jgi:hypothetical protein